MWREVAEGSAYGKTHRLWVPGGWILRVVEIGMSNRNLRLIFIADPNHEWELEK